MTLQSLSKRYPIFHRRLRRDLVEREIEKERELWGKGQAGMAKGSTWPEVYSVPYSL